MIKILLSLITFFAFYFDRRPYEKLINTWCSLFNIKVKYYSRYSDKFEVDVVDGILYISRYNKATHTPREYIYSLAHEIGHLIDHAYKEYYNKMEDDDEEQEMSRQSIYADEVQAWKIARVLLIEAGEPNLYNVKEFNALRKKCLDEYKRVLEI
jgi:hypothetical protein